MEVEIRMSEDGLRDVRELVSAARKSIGQPSGDGTTLAGEMDGSYVCAVASGYDRFRVQVDRLVGGAAYWVFRRLHVPKATKLNFGFDVA
ncbi:hypothetical protein D3C87_1696140 [compost metagenome]